MRLTRGGAIDGRIATHFLDPSFKNQGFAQAGGLGFNPFPSAGFRQRREGEGADPTAGFANGMYKGPQVTRWRTTRRPARTPAQVVAADMAKIGFDVRRSRSRTPRCTRSTATSRRTSRTSARTWAGCRTSTSRRRARPTFAEEQDHAGQQLELAAPERPHHQRAIGRGRAHRGPEPAGPRGARSTTMVTQSAAAIPWIWENFPTLYSKHVTPASELWNGGAPDVTFMSVSGLDRRVTSTTPTPALPPPGPPARGGSTCRGARSGSVRLVVDAALRRAPHALGRIPARRRQRADLRHLHGLPVGRPGRTAAGPPGDARADRADPHNLGLDKPLYVQYWLFLKGIVLHFDLGYSYQNSVSVKSQIFTRLPVTLSLTAARVRDLDDRRASRSASSRRSGARSLLDRATMGAALVAISAPVYFLGLVALFLFSNDIGVVHLLPGRRQLHAALGRPWRWFTSLLMPWCVLAAAFAAFYARMVRGNLIDTMGEDYIRTARAKGLSERRVVGRHGLRAALTPVVTMAGLDIGILLGGAILTETVFNIPGIGRYAYDSISTPTCRRSRAPSSSARSSSSPRTSSSTSCTRSSTRACGTDGAPRDPATCTSRFATRGRHRPCRRRRLARRRPRPHARRRRRVRLGQERHRADRHGSHAASERDHLRDGAARRRRPADPAGGRAAARPRQAHRDDLPGPAVVAPSALQGRLADRRGDPGARATCRRRRRGARALEALREVGIPSAAERIVSYPHELSAGCDSA